MFPRANECPYPSYIETAVNATKTIKRKGGREMNKVFAWMTWIGVPVSVIGGFLHWLYAAALYFRLVTQRRISA